MTWENIISLYAAIVASIALAWQIFDSWKNRKPHFLVICDFKIDRSEENGVYYFKNMKIKIINTKEVPRKVKLYGIEFVNGKSTAIQMYDKITEVFEFSEILSNSKEHIIEVADEFLKWLRPASISKFRIVIIDNTNTRYHSNFYETLTEVEKKYNITSVDSSKILK